MTSALTNWGQFIANRRHSGKSGFFQDSVHRLPPTFFTTYQQGEPAPVLVLLRLSAVFRTLIITIKENR